MFSTGEQEEREEQTPAEQGARLTDRLNPSVLG